MTLRWTILCSACLVTNCLLMIYFVQNKDLFHHFQRKLQTVFPSFNISAIYFIMSKRNYLMGKNIHLFSWRNIHFSAFHSLSLKQRLVDIDSDLMALQFKQVQYLATGYGEIDSDNHNIRHDRVASWLFLVHSIENNTSCGGDDLFAVIFWTSCNT